MDELIKINYENDTPRVLGRELYELLEPKTDYRHWFSRMCEYGFIEGKDYRAFLTDRIDGKAGKPRKDHQLTIQMAKEICMIQRNEKGKQARQYFIDIEEQWNKPELIMARALKLAKTQIDGLVTNNYKLQYKIVKQKPLVQFAKTIRGSNDKILIRQVAKLASNYDGINIGEKQLFQRLRDWGLVCKLKNEPTAYAKRLGLLELVTYERIIRGFYRVCQTTYATPKGQQYIINRLIKEAGGSPRKKRELKFLSQKGFKREVFSNNGSDKYRIGGK